MKTKLATLKLLILLCSAFATTAVFGQTTYTWTGAADGTNFYAIGNWSPSYYPIPCFGDTAQWDGVTTSNLLINYNSGPIVEYCGTGINLVLTPNQTNSVQIISSVAQSSSLSMFGISNNSASATFILGNGSTNVLNIVMRPAGVTHDWVNNSTNAAIICPNVRWQAGGGQPYTLAFDGTGNWIVTNNLTCANTTPVNIAVLGSGTLLWAGPSIPAALGNSIILSPVVINNGTVVLKSSGLLANQAIQNNGATPTLLQYDAAAQSQTLGGAISGPMALKVSNGTLTLAGANTYTGNTEINNNGTLQVGAGGTSGSIGTNNVTDLGALVFNRSDSVTFGGGISGTGSVVQYGSGTLTLNGLLLTYTGSTTVNNGTLVITGSSVAGAMNVSGGTLVEGGVGTVGTLNVSNNMNISSGTVLVSLNKSLSPSNTTFAVTGAINYTGGKLKLLNFGPSLVVGDKFTIFNPAVTGGAAMTIVSPGITVANGLAVDGSVTVSAILPPATVTATRSGGQLILSWPAGWTGLHLQSQTNALTKGLGTNWVTIPGTDAANGYTNTLNTSNGSVFYRLAP